MDYEKKYKEALEKAYKLCAYPTTKPFISDLQDLFPELKESEDERIRKEIISYLKRRLKFDSSIPAAIGYWIAWLEKQAEHARFREAIQVCDQVTKNEDGVLVNLSQLSRVAKKDEKQGEKKPTKWSEEDEKNIDFLIHLIEHNVPNHSFAFGDGCAYGCKSKEEAINMLKSLKERVQPQPKQEWSEEDKDIKETIIGELELVKKSVGEINYNGYDKLIDWLKSLRPQNTWKPSDEQMEALEKVTNYSAFHDAKYCVELKRLLGQLKAL